MNLGEPKSIIDAVAESQQNDPLSPTLLEPLSFRVSTGLKRVLGRELITDDEVAIFELVKNSYDAGAKNVYLHFSENSITVADDGSGMSYDDLKNKWLFVAYSSKQKHKQGSDSYRDQVGSRQHYAGSKGIGRFASDRLGKSLVLQTRNEVEVFGLVHRVVVDWSKFDEDDSQQFSGIDVTYSKSKEFDSPFEIPTPKHGTVIEIKRLLKKWSRQDILKLKAGLSKLINPFGDSVDDFVITIISDTELGDDQKVFAYSEEEDVSDDDRHKVVNGPIGNFIFSTLRQKTTFIDVAIDKATNKIKTTLTDRGEIIYTILEPNVYPFLREAKFCCQLYFLNRSAKATFSRRMGVQPVSFGSIFLFRNGFRVFPVGEVGDDSFGIDRRKAQGYNRFLGTRDTIGKIDVEGDDSLFQEASSRNQGLISTPAVEELKKCFMEHCLKRLERYVVPVLWEAKDGESDTLALIENDNGRALVTNALAKLIDNKNVEVLHYSRRLINILNERSSLFENSLSNLRVIALKTQDRELSARVDEAEARFLELRESEAEARRIADRERLAKQQMEARLAAAEAKASNLQTELVEEHRRSLFLTSLTSLDAETIENMHHLIIIYSADVQQQIDNFMLHIRDTAHVTQAQVVNHLESISMLNRKVLAVARFATKANFRVQSEQIEDDLSSYISDYINEIAAEFVGGRIAIDVCNDGKEFKRKFKPIEIAIVVDNLINNARKARATKIEFCLEQPRKGTLEIRVSDDGKGVSSEASIKNRLFEKGFTTTDGSGLGLYHVRQVLGEMGGSIELVESKMCGASFLLRINK